MGSRHPFSASARTGCTSVGVGKAEENIYVPQRPAVFHPSVGGSFSVWGRGYQNKAVTLLLMKKG